MIVSCFVVLEDGDGVSVGFSDGRDSRAVGNFSVRFIVINNSYNCEIHNDEIAATMNFRFNITINTNSFTVT